jgi:hypothetical protein
VFFCALAVMSGGNGYEDEGKHGENQRLDGADKKFQAHEDDRENERKQETDHKEQHFASQNIAKETESEGQNFDDFQD